MRQLDEVIRRPWFPAAAGILGILALAVIVIALAGGGDGGRTRGRRPPAPASAPLDSSSEAWTATIDAAASR